MLNIQPKQLALFLVKIVGLLVLANCLALVAIYHLQDDYLGGFVPLFDLDHEKNLPTLFSTVLLLICSGLLAMIYVGHSQKRQTCRLWLMLAVVFLFLAMDEFVAIHEHISSPIRHLISASGVFFFAWVIPYGVLMLILAAAYGRFVLELPAAPRLLFIIAFVTYIGGALGMEMLGGRYYEMHRSQPTLTYSVLATIEETLEMVGLIVFIYSLMLYIEQVQKGLKLQLAGPTLDVEAPRLIGTQIKLVKSAG
ncbi:MAG TPA: hypothetical protein VFF74_04440 [Methylophilaceae bacterium]|nr:hypothetical protein [Methylophilaceae bacterium]